MQKKYKLVVHTNQYSGNFERQMCAFMTGCIGECGVGDEFVQSNIDYTALDGLIGSEPDEHGCCRPVEIYPTPGWSNSSSFHVIL